ncbi:hypothetical protein NQ318_009499 [Aromia moschata]|uniref:Telomerase reverse transcriptase n=1 Tax=Aromia moschata TaxID=1265417 RepID=A0AAV8ZA90_9CUCU|nr:hypothetical protein NQ318_009499 [Aromia moschata]
MGYYQLSLDKKLSKIWKKDKYCKKLKRKIAPFKPGEIILMRISERLRNVKDLECIYVGRKITTILDEVIGADYFGTTQNRKRFYHLVNKITTQSRFECVYLSSLSKDYDIKRIPWLQEENLDESQSRQMLRRTNLYLLTYIVKPLIKHFYHALKNFRGYEVKFIPRRKWHSHQHKIFNEIVGLRYLIAIDFEACKSRGTLRLFPKIDSDRLEYRPLISPTKCSVQMKIKLRRLLKQIDHLAREISASSNVSLFVAWKRYSKSTAGQRIYGVKLDIKDAFGNVNVERLCYIITESKLNETDKDFIINHIRNQYVSFHKKFYRWNHGLLQGDRLSSSLCNLFLSDFETTHLLPFRKPDQLLHRIVDDYFFCSTNESDMEHFEHVIRCTFELNDSKTQRVTNNNTNYEIIYFGQVFNLTSREVVLREGVLSDINSNFGMLKKLIPEGCKQDIVQRTLSFPYNNHCFKRMELNTKFNTEEKVLKNFFEGMIFVAFKFDAAVMAIRDYRQDADDIPSLTLILEKVICDYSNIVYFKIRRGPSQGEYFRDNITFRLLKNIAYRAFILVLRKSFEFYKGIIKDIKENNNLYLDLENFQLSVENFSKLPYNFENVNLGRRSKI